MEITSRYADVPDVLIDESKILPALRHLLPLAREWSIADDVELVLFDIATNAAATVESML